MAQVLEGARLDLSHAFPRELDALADFGQRKRVLAVEPKTPVILCSRCVRFTDEITKTGEFGIFNRGDQAELGIYLSAPESPNAGAPDWNAIQAAKDHTIALAAATRDAMIAIQIMEWPVPEGRTLTSWLRECRARLFYNIHDREIESQYWCYEHNQARNKGSNGYGHPVEGGWCIWEKGIIMDDQIAQEE